MNIDINNTKAVGLLMTYRCNLNCKYCYIQSKRNIDMALEMAKKTLEPFLLIDGKLLDIKFYGGETLMAFNVIRPLVEWVESNNWKRKYRFFGSTNGTLLTSEIKEWLEKRANTFVLGLSYDGLPSSQLNNRGNKDIDLDFFIRTWPNQPIQMTINEQSVKQMAEGIKYLLLKGATVHPNVAYEETEWSNDSLNEYARQLNDLIFFYIENPQYPNITQFKHDLLEYAKQISTPSAPGRVCGAGGGFLLFDVDGRHYPCHILSPLVIGGEKLKKIAAGELDKTTDFADSRCINCPFTTTCPTCLACNFVYRNSFKKRDRTHCEIMKLEVKAFIKKQILKFKSAKVLTYRDKSEFEAIKKLLKYFQMENARSQQK